jgi:hypothetical protein
MVENELQRYKDFAPTPFDPKGLNLDDQQDWLVSPVSVTRDTADHDYTKSNWKVIETELEKVDPDNYQVHNFGHWACGWFDILIVKPGSLASETLVEFCNQLEDYPILDDEMHSEMEHTAALESWQWLDLDDRVKAIQYSQAQGLDVSIFAARCDDMPSVQYENHSDGIYFF